MRDRKKRKSKSLKLSSFMNIEIYTTNVWSAGIFSLRKRISIFLWTSKSNTYLEFLYYIIYPHHFSLK